jgi:hypothetical protein
MARQRLRYARSNKHATNNTGIPFRVTASLGRIAAKYVDRESDVSSVRGFVLVTKRNIWLRHGKSEPSLSVNKRLI